MKTAGAEDCSNGFMFQSECGFPYNGDTAEQDGVLHGHFEDSAG